LNGFISVIGTVSTLSTRFPNFATEPHALNTGHAGSISTVHANSPLQSLFRLATLSLRADVDIPYRAVQGEIGDPIQLVVYIERRDGQRRIAEVLEVNGFDAERGRYESTPIYAN
jgi:pilus assembly protein CpaF